MSPRLKIAVLFFLMTLAATLVAGAVLGKSDNQDGAYKPLAVYTEVLARIKSDYVESPDIDKVTLGALQGLVEYLDPMSSYLSAEQYEDYLERIKNPDKGTGHSTGLIVHKRANYTAVLSVLPGSSAERAGIRVGDLIEAVDNISTRALPPALFYSRLSGEPGSTVQLLLRAAATPDEPKELILKREDVNFPDVTSKMLDGGVGYIDMDVVDKERIEQVGAAAKKLTGQGANQLILDLRENAIGAPADGFSLADLFVAEGKLGSLNGQRFPEKAYEATKDATVTDVQLAVLVDRPTSRAAEVAAGAILGADRGFVVGERTYGLASQQEMIALEEGAALILSVAKFYPPDGEAIHINGVVPNIAVEPGEVREYRDPEKPADAKDPFIEKALDALSGEIEPVEPEEKAARLGGSAIDA